MFWKPGVNEYLCLQSFVRVYSFINVQELVQQSKFSNQYETKYRYTIKIQVDTKPHTCELELFVDVYSPHIPINGTHNPVSGQKPGFLAHNTLVKSEFCWLRFLK